MTCTRYFLQYQPLKEGRARRTAEKELQILAVKTRAKGTAKLINNAAIEAFDCRPEPRVDIIVQSEVGSRIVAF